MFQIGPRTEYALKEPHSQPLQGLYDKTTNQKRLPLQIVLWELLDIYVIFIVIHWDKDIVY